MNSPATADHAPRKPKGGKGARRLDRNGGLEQRAAANRLRAFELRCQRLSYPRIGAALGVDGSTAFRYVSDYLDTVRAATRETAEQLVAMELQTLDELEARWKPLALADELHVEEASACEGKRAPMRMQAFEAGLKAVDRVLRIQERRAKLMGLEAAQKLQHSGAIRLEPAEVLARVRAAVATFSHWHSAAPVRS